MPPCQAPLPPYLMDFSAQSVNPVSDVARYCSVPMFTERNNLSNNAMRSTKSTSDDTISFLYQISKCVTTKNLNYGFDYIQFSSL